MIGIITYDFPHRKTQDLIARLIFNGYNNLIVFATPYVERKNFQPLFMHRPGGAVKVSVHDLCMRLNLKYIRAEVSELNDYFREYQLEHILIAGAGILPEETVKNHRIINSHPGYLPNVKGLDALKWAIYHNQPIGVTTHYVSEKADEGLLIERRIIPTYFEDTFHSVAYRQYETEIEMLVNSIEVLKTLDANEELADEKYKATRRMPHHMELKMMDEFHRLIKKSPSFIQ